ncbi:MAG: hypothetical protein FRX49_02807 [Trebouxia sp. A1-2]|nr:MAG: hypothetical protein FRX49_02807 [Trebouxia sp. A1-2]
MRQHRLQQVNVHCHDALAPSQQYPKMSTNPLTLRNTPTGLSPELDHMGAYLNPARPEAVVGYTSHKLLVAQLGTMVTPRPSPTATQRMNLLRRVSGSIEMTCIQHDTLSTLIAMPHWESSSWDYCEMYQQQQLTMEQKGGRLNDLYMAKVLTIS